MSKKKPVDKTARYFNIYRNIGIIGGTRLFSSAILNSSLFEYLDTQYHDENDLGDGYRFVPAEIPKNVIDSHRDYYHLEKDGKQLSKHYFRKSGSSKEKPFENDNYAQLIMYEIGRYSKKVDPKQKLHMISRSVIINCDGQVVLDDGGKALSYVSYLKGHVGTCERIYYNLKTQSQLFDGQEARETIVTDQHLIVRLYDNKLKKHYAVALNFETLEEIYFN